MQELREELRRLLDLTVEVEEQGSVFGYPTSPGTVSPLRYDDRFYFHGPLRELPRALCQWRHSGNLTYRSPTGYVEEKCGRYISFITSRLSSAVEAALQSAGVDLPWIDVVTVARYLRHRMCGLCQRFDR